jgi:hypothetical protein
MATNDPNALERDGSGKASASAFAAAGSLLAQAWNSM